MYSILIIDFKEEEKNIYTICNSEQVHNVYDYLNTYPEPITTKNIVEVLDNSTFDLTIPSIHAINISYEGE